MMNVRIAAVPFFATTMIILSFQAQAYEWREAALSSAKLASDAAYVLESSSAFSLPNRDPVIVTFWRHRDGGRTYRCFDHYYERGLARNEAFCETPREY